MIKFATINVDGERVDWTFDTIEEMLIDWWTNDGINLPSDDDKVVDKRFTYNGTRYSVSTFDDVINDIEIIYWNEKRMGVR